ncbi:MAG: class I SAM-dependent DNA methyltransferase, partial [Proteobacteria bacterium]|nr:class I SAM-dependent DNA methyltransferase [Pseudomonadota bacterium]
RTLQRNFIAEILKNSFKTYALVAFVSSDEANWRFSLVKLEISFSENNFHEKLSSARRFSFLVGKNEGTHTVQSQFLKFFIDETQNIAPTIAQIEKLFDIETVTNKFFEKYKELFCLVQEGLQDLFNNDEKIKNDFIAKEISIPDFAKKTLGQIVFLYFLQKKGWFGVKNDKDWGSGDKNFLRQLFEKNKENQNFFNDVLEHLFYEALAQDRGINAIYTKLDCRMPFLNGGLFEPMNGYAWETTKINLPNQIFSNNNSTKEGDVGDGIFDVFDRYNFTVNENEPLEQEVAVDPEMLGKVFENLLEIKDRKSKGAFYTPREIVHYMCQESLINYLHNHCDLPMEQLTNFIKNKSLENIENSALKIDSLLENVKICDPAVGSGAFMLGMLNE